MKISTWRRLTALLLCIVMLLGLFVTTAPEAYAAETGGETSTVNWPQLKKLAETPTVNKWHNVTWAGGTAATIKDYKITQYSEKKEPSEVAAVQPAYEVGLITIYLDKLPSDSEVIDSSYLKLNLATLTDGCIAWNGTKPHSTTPETFSGKTPSLRKRINWKQNSSTFCYLQTEDGAKYYYQFEIAVYDETATVDWPQLKKLAETPTVNKWHNVTWANRTAATIKDYKITQYSEKKEPSEVAAVQPAYEVGLITIYLDKLPSDSEVIDSSYLKLNLATLTDGCIAWNGTKPHSTTPETFSGKTPSLRKRINWKQNSSTFCYLQTEDGAKYYYQFEIAVYTGSVGEKLTLSGGSATRTSKESATVKFNASATGSYYYALYDQQQTAPLVDTTSANANTGTMAKTNTITISNLTDCGKKYLYVVGVDAAGKASDPLEIVIPGKTFKLLHNKQGLRGFTTINSSEDETIVAGWLYTEEFKDASGKTISEAAVGDTVTVNFGVFPPDAVSSIDDICYDSTTNAIKDTTDIRRHVLKLWNITGVDVSPGTSTSFTFTMPENDVTIQAETELSGVPVYLTSASETISANLQCYALNINSATFNEPLCYYRDKKDCVVAGTTVKLSASNIPEAYLLGKWQITNNGSAVDESKITYDENNNPILTLEEGGNYVFTATFLEKKYASVTAGVNDSKMGTATVVIADGEASSSAYPVYEGQTITLTATPGNERYLLESWEVKDADGTVIDVTKDGTDPNKATFTMPATGKAITAKAIFKVDSAYASAEKELISVALCSADGNQLGTVSNLGTAWTITLPADMDVSQLSTMKLKLTASEYATITKSGDTGAKDWASGQPCGMTLNEAATFTVTAENGDTQDYTITIKRIKSSNTAITAAVLLNQTDDTVPMATAEISGTSIIFTLPENTDAAVLNSIGMKYLKLTYAESASVAMTGGYSDASGTYKWRNGDVMCNMSLNTPATFVVTAEDGTTTKTYTITIKQEAAPDAPTLSDGSAERTGKTSATVTFTSSEAGMYFYGTSETVDTTKNGSSASAGENSFTLPNLTESASSIYIVVKNANDVESAPLKVDIPVYGGSTVPDTGAYSITYSGPKGGKLVPSRTKANKGDTITVTAVPDSGYQMVAGSMTYTLAVSGGTTTKITGNQFTMPEGDVTLSCQWETATVSAKCITAFTINGVSAAVNNTTNVITITLPRGTDVTKLTPVISTSGVKSLSPASGKTVDFTNSVTYTATMDDGSTKTYTVTVYVDKGSLADRFWDKLTDFYNQTPWWQYAEHQQSTKKYPKYW